MKPNLIPLLALVSGISLATAACSKHDETSNADTTAAADTAATPTAVAANDHASQFLTDAMKGDNSEVRVGKLRRTRARARA